MKTCSVEGCNQKHRSLGYCDLHYCRWRAYGDARADVPPKQKAHGRVCAVDGCESPVRCKSLCGRHYDRMRRTGTTDEPPSTPRARCKVNGCAGLVHCLGYCEPHEQRVRAHGDPMPDIPIKFIPTGRLRTDIVTRILSRSTEGPDGCIEWQGHRARGYGSVQWQGRSWPVHLAHWIAVNGHLPNDDWTLDHLCYNRACVNLQHLEPVTRGENTMRAILRKRTGVARIPDEVLDFLRKASAATLEGAHLFDAFAP